MAKASPNQGGGNNRQGPKVRKGSTGPITDGWNLSKGKPMSGRNMAGHSWTRPRPASHRQPEGRWYLGGSKGGPPSHPSHPR